MDFAYSFIDFVGGFYNFWFVAAGDLPEPETTHRVEELK